MRNKLFIILFIFAIGFLAFVIGTFSSDVYVNDIKQVEVKYVNNPVILYQTVGIKECGYDNRHKGKRSGAVLLKGDDSARAITFLGTKFGKGITTVLYINAPEANKQRRGQPALLALVELKGGVYCSLGIAGSYSIPLFLEFEKKYQDQIRKIYK